MTTRAIRTPTPPIKPPLIGTLFRSFSHPLILGVTTRAIVHLINSHTLFQFPLPLFVIFSFCCERPLVDLRPEYFQAPHADADRAVVYERYVPQKRSQL